MEKSLRPVSSHRSPEVGEWDQTRAHRIDPTATPASSFLTEERTGEA
jgi:hypothetical protein